MCRGEIQFGGAVACIYGKRLRERLYGLLMMASASESLPQGTPKVRIAEHCRMYVGYGQHTFDFWILCEGGKRQTGGDVILTGFVEAAMFVLPPRTTGTLVVPTDLCILYWNLVCSLR
jgi:hypothetical protein